MKNKKMNNKGFSLVELIVVIAIMAVFMAVLSPTYLRFVEKARLQKDNSAIAEIAEAIKISAADETVLKAIGTSKTITITNTANTDVNYTFSSSDTLEKEIAAVVGTTFKTSSTKYNTSSTAITIVVTNTDGVVSVKVTGGYAATPKDSVSDPANASDDVQL